MNNYQTRPQSEAHKREEIKVKYRGGSQWGLCASGAAAAPAGPASFGVQGDSTLMAQNNN